MKIVSSGKVINSSKFYEKKKKIKRLKLILALVAFLLISVSLVLVARQEKFLVSSVVVLGQDVIDRDEIAGVANKLLSGYYFWLIPKSNLVFFPREEIKQAIIDGFPRLKSVSLNLGDERVLNISVEERVPFALYCVDAINPTRASDCYFLDSEGLIFALAPSFSGAVVYFTYATRVPIEKPIGQRFVAVEEFKLLQTFMQNLSSLNMQPVALELEGDEYHLYLATDNQIMWQRGSDLNVVRTNLDSFLADEAIKSQGDFMTNILYLDLRTDNKVFYKFKN